MDNSRKRLRPWLRAKIDSGNIPGLCWLNEKKTIFRIPWKHGGKQDWSPEDSQIFMEWAKHTGKFREGMDKPDYARWKTRLRCAFNKAPDIKERKDWNNLDDPNPYKVYEFLPPKTPSRLPGMTDGQPDSDSEEDEDIIPTPKANLIPQTVRDVTNERDSTSMSLSSDKSLPSDLKGIRREDLVRDAEDDMNVHQLIKEEQMDCSGVPSDKEQGMVDLRTFPTNQQTGAPSLMTNQPQAAVQPQPNPIVAATSDLRTNYHLPPQVEEYPQAAPFTFMKDVPDDMDVHLNKFATEEKLLSEGPATGSLDGFLPSGMDLQQLQGDVEVEMLSGNQLNVRLVGNDPEPVEKYELQGHEMLLKIQYCEDVVEEQWILHTGGCRLYYGTSHHHDKIRGMKDVADELIGPSEMYQIHMPPNDHLYRKPGQATHAKELLNCMERGVLLECKNGDIYARRLCRCVVYYSSSYRDNGEPMKLSRQVPDPVKVFDYQQEFLPAFKAYTESGNQLPAPCAEVRFGIGQPWKFDQSSANILISLRIFSGKAVADLGLIPDAQPACPGSATAVQISDKDIFDELNSGLKNCDITDPLTTDVNQVLRT